MYEPRKQPRMAAHGPQQLALTPTQPAGPPPDHLLRAVQHTGTSLARLPTTVADQDCPTRAYNILRWLGYALLHGFQALGIDVVDGWAHLHQLAKAAASDRRDLEGLTPGALRRVIEQDTTGRWMIVTGFARYHVMPGGSPFRLHRWMITKIFALACATSHQLLHHQ